MVIHQLPRQLNRELHKHGVSADCIETEDDNYLFLINFIKNFIFCSRKCHAETRKERRKWGESRVTIFTLPNLPLS